MALTVDIYVEEASNPDAWTLIASGLQYTLGSYGYDYPAAGTYRFRVELWDGATLLDTSITDPVVAGKARTLTQEMKTLLGGRQRSDRTWLFVEDADGLQRDWSTFLLGYDISFSLDSPVGNATVRIRREHYEASLAPDLDASSLNQKRDGTYGPAIDIGRQFTIWVAPVDVGQTPTFSDAWLIFCGRIDEHDFSHAEATFSGRDIHGRLMDTWIEEVRTYGAAEPGVPAEDVIEQILTDTEPEVLLYVPEGIDAQFGLYNQEKGPLLPSARQRALEVGADLRGLFRDDTGDFLLWLYQPDRLATEPEYVFSKDEWFEVTQLRVAITNIRNAVEGSYINSDGVRVYVGDMEAAPLDDPDALVHANGAEVRDPISIEKYGKRWAELSLGTDSPVRTLAAFQALQEAFVLDLSEPEAELTIRTVFFWPAGLNRIYGFEADGLRFSEQRNFACVGYRHVYQKGQGSNQDTWETYITTRGRPAAALREYLQFIRPPGRPSEPAPPPDEQVLITQASATLIDPETLNVRIEWTLASVGEGQTVSIGEDKGLGVFNTIASGLEATDGADAFDHNITGETTNTVRYRIYVVDGAEVVATRTTAPITLP